MSADVAEKKARVKSNDLMSMEAEFLQGKRIRTASSEHPDIVTLLTTLQAISPDSTWKDNGKPMTRTEATSMMMQLGEPFLFFTINPFDVYSPLVMNYGGNDINLSSTYMQRTDARLCSEPKNRCGRPFCIISDISFTKLLK